MVFRPSPGPLVHTERVWRVACPSVSLRRAAEVGSPAVLLAKLALDGRTPAERRHRDTAVAAEQVRVRARSVDVARVPLVRAWVLPRAPPRPRAQVEAAEIVPAGEGAAGCGEGVA